MADTGQGVTFTVQYDDMSYMGLWCSACLAAGLQGNANLLWDMPGNRYDTEWPLERFNEMAAAHLRDKHGASPVTQVPVSARIAPVVRKNLSSGS